MSRLCYSETGNVVTTLCEELTAYRRARKTLDLPAPEAPGRLYLLARAYPGVSSPLRLSCNGQELPPIPASGLPIYRWYETEVPPGLLKSGENIFDFWTDAPAMNAWSLAIEDGHASPASQISTDGGETWRSEKMGYLNVSRGEYVVRVRLAEGQDPPPPAMAWENLAHPRLARLRTLLPAAALGKGTTCERVRALCTWVSTGWEYRHSGMAAQYAPWDPETIMAWGAGQQGHDGRVPIVMCVHYGVTLAMACLAAGIPARCAIYTEELNGVHGHFTPEVWFPEYEKWVMVDPTVDAVLFRDGIPMSVPEIQAAGGDLGRFAEYGPGTDFQRRTPFIADWIREVFETGICFRHRSLWPRMDFLSHPELTPSGHGSTAYCETSLVWEERDREAGYGMFSYFGAPGYFDAAPEWPGY